MAKRYDPIMCMMVDEPTKAHDELSLAQKKQVVTELKGYLKKSYNFSDESEYERAYEDLRHMFTTGSRKSISGLFENTVKKTGAHDAKAKDKLVKVPDSKLKDFEANIRSAGFKVVSKSDRGMSTHYQVEVSSGKTFTEADLREWANKIDAVCDKMDSVAPTTWNIGLTADGKITAGLDVREMYVKDSASALDEAIKTCDAVDVDRISNYLWLWVEGREVASLLFNEGLDKYSGPHDKEHKDEAYDFAKKYAQKELDALYSKLKSSVEKKLKEGYTNTKNYISGAR